MLAKDFLQSLDDKNQLKKYKDIRFIVQKDSDAGTLSGDIKAFYDYKNIKLALKKPQDDYDEYFFKPRSIASYRRGCNERNLENN